MKMLIVHRHVVRITEVEADRHQIDTEMKIVQDMINVIVHQIELKHDTDHVLEGGK